jgi:hypothetical protein
LLLLGLCRSVAAYKSVKEDEPTAEVEDWIAKHSGAKGRR